MTTLTQFYNLIILITNFTINLFLILFESSLTNDFILLLYFIKLSKKLLKKLFIHWKHDFDIYSLFNEQFYSCDIHIFENVTFLNILITISH